MQCVYSGFLKRVPYVDVAVIAAGFVLRAVAGAAAMGVRISPWLLACAFGLSLFLALCKRCHEKRVACASRAALEGYHPRMLGLLIALSALATLVVYTCYTLCADTVTRFGTRRLVWTAPFVALGLLRYVFLLRGTGDVGRPEKVLLSDRVLWGVLLGYAATAAWVLLA
jgi:4-hydroxybenzoate polyprenyltransferase